MVALAVRTIDSRPVACHARPLLFKAHAALERNALVEAGCLLREAIRLYLYAECEYWGCVPKRKDAGKAAPSVLLKSLKATEPTSDYGWDWMEEIIGYCNKLAHCQYVRPELVRTSIDIVFLYLDQAHYLKSPAAEGRLS